MWFQHPRSVGSDPFSGFFISMPFTHRLQLSESCITDLLSLKANTKSKSQCKERLGTHRTHKPTTSVQYEPQKKHNQTIDSNLKKSFSIALLKADEQNIGANSSRMSNSILTNEYQAMPLKEEQKE